MRAALSGLVAAALLLAVAPAADAASATLAVVGGEPISAEYLDAARDLEQQPASVDRDVLLRHLVERKLLAQIARRDYPDVEARTSGELRRERVRLLGRRYLEREVWAGLTQAQAQREAADRRVAELRKKYRYAEEPALADVLSRNVLPETLAPQTVLARFQGGTITARDFVEEIALSSRERQHGIRSGKGMKQAFDALGVHLLLSAAAADGGLDRDPVFAARLALIRDVVTTRELVALVRAQASGSSERQQQIVAGLLEKARREIAVSHPAR